MNPSINDAGANLDLQIRQYSTTQWRQTRCPKYAWYQKRIADRKTCGLRSKNSLDRVCGTVKVLLSRLERWKKKNAKWSSVLAAFWEKANVNQIKIPCERRLGYFFVERAGHLWSWFFRLLGRILRWFVDYTELEIHEHSLTRLLMQYSRKAWDGVIGLYLDDFSCEWRLYRTYLFLYPCLSKNIYYYDDLFFFLIYKQSSAAVKSLSVVRLFV